MDNRGPSPGSAFREHRTRFPVVTPATACTTPPAMDERAIRRAALTTVRRAICERFPPGPERRAWQWTCPKSLRLD